MKMTDYQFSLKKCNESIVDGLKYSFVKVYM